ncbi:hypothetical protein M3205_16400, partial [Cytobacillus firmus]|uniref:hypothetical protein n=1 Tax=Cytobacillus firmus TaxID=1399 RepID=UPI002041CAAA
ETPQTRSVEEAHRPPRGSLSILSLQSTDNIDKRKTTIYTKRAKEKDQPKPFFSSTYTLVI